MLPYYVQRTPRGGEQRDARCHAEQFGDHLRGLGKLLEIVEHQQSLPVRDVLEERRRGAAVTGDAERLGNRRPHDRRLGHRREPHEENPVREAIGDRFGSSQSEPGLPDSAWPGHGDQANGVRSGEQILHIAEFRAARDERRQRPGKAAPVAQALERGERVRQAGDHQLVKMLGLGDVLQPVPAQVGHFQVSRAIAFLAAVAGVRELARDQLAGGLGHDHLAAVCRRRDPGSPVHVHAHVAVLVPRRLPGVQAHPDQRRNTLRPGVAGQRPLTFSTGAHRVDGRGEHHEEAVPLGPHLGSQMRGEGAAQQPALGRQEIGVGGAEPAQQLRRPLHVAEKHGHGPRRQPHPGIVPTAR